VSLPAPQRTPLGMKLLEHLAIQLQSAQTLLEHVLGQGRAIRAREVDGVLAHLAAVQAEMERRGNLERDRAAILIEAAGHLGIAPHAVTLDAMAGLLADAEAHAAREASAQLRGMLDQIAQEHRLNRALMKQELAFLDHLTRMLTGNGAEEAGYRPPNQAGAPFTRSTAPRASALRALDLQA
jgi:hypothetical protein